MAVAAKRDSASVPSRATIETRPALRRAKQITSRI